MRRVGSAVPVPALVLASVLVVALPLAGQTTCDLVGSNYFRTVQGAGGDIVFVSRPIIRCRDGTRISADSAEIYSARNLSQFFGNVAFHDSTTVLTSGRANFFSREGRLRAWEDVVLTDRQEGSRITGDTLVYLRPTEARPTEQVTVTGRRPHATLYPAPASADTTATGSPESSNAPPDSVEPRPGRDAISPAKGDLRGKRLPVESDTAAVVPDTSGTPPDTTGTLPGATGTSGDTVSSPPDTLAPPADTTASPDSPSEPTVSTTAGGRDTVAVRDTTGTPYEVDADRIFLEGDRYFRATGNVELTRDSLEAYADSVEYDEQAGRLFLMDSARLLAADYVLLGRTITLLIPAGEISEVVSRRDAELTGEDLRLTAPEIRLFMTEGRAERLVAVHRLPEADSTAGRSRASRDSVAAPPQPRAVASQFVLTADSIEAQTPAEVLERVIASGRARGESLTRDSLNAPDTPQIARRDWLEGDTVVATFEPDTSSVAPDSADARYRLERVVAIGNARSLYRMEPSDSVGADRRLALHYVQGRRISIQMDEGDVSEMEVEGQTRGVYLEPLRASRPDTTAVPRPGGPR